MGAFQIVAPYFGRWAHHRGQAVVGVLTKHKAQRPFKMLPSQSLSVRATSKSVHLLQA